MFKNLRKKKKGFTLIELIIVIAIIAILAAFAVPKFGSITKDAKEKADIANAKTIANAVSALVADGSINETVASIEVEKDADDDTDSKDIENYLQNIPKTKTNGNFFVKVTDGKVTVYKDSIADTNIVFPQN